MKTLGRLEIKPEKAIKNEELLQIKGGFGDDQNAGCCTCYKIVPWFIYGSIDYSTSMDCSSDCISVYGGGVGIWAC